MPVSKIIIPPFCQQDSLTIMSPCQLLTFSTSWYINWRNKAAICTKKLFCVGPLFLILVNGARGKYDERRGDGKSMVKKLLTVVLLDWLNVALREKCPNTDQKNTFHAVKFKYYIKLWKWHFLLCNLLIYLNRTIAILCLFFTCIRLIYKQMETECWNWIR